MRIFRTPAFALLMLVLLYSCAKEKSLEGGTVKGPSEWEFKESGVMFRGMMDTAYYQNAGSLTSLILEGTSSDGTGSFFLQLFGVNIAAGNYSNPNVLFQYMVNGAMYYENDPTNPGKFNVTITNIDSGSVSGTFSGEVFDALAGTKTVTDGKFSAKFKRSGTGANGQLMLWSKKGCTGGGNLLVKVQSKTASITTFYAAEPACGSVGTAVFYLPPGNYTWKANCGTDSTEGNITVSSGSCTVAEVILGSPPGAQCRISNIAYYDPLSNSALGSITSFFNAANQVTKIQLYDSSSSTLKNEFNLTYSGTQIKVDAVQYFISDASQRVREFHGYLDPTDNTSARVIFTYQYDASGYLSKAFIALESAPTIILLEITYLWTAGNLTKVIIKEAGTGKRTEIEYQYDLNKQAKNFLCFFPNAELIIFQTAVNYGKNSTNVPIKSITKDYDASNNVLNTDVSDFINHVFDANGYIRSFQITGDGSVYDTNVKYILSYKCS